MLKGLAPAAEPYDEEGVEDDEGDGGGKQQQQQQPQATVLPDGVIDVTPTEPPPVNIVCVTSPVSVVGPFPRDLEAGLWNVVERGIDIFAERGRNGTTQQGVLCRAVWSFLDETQEGALGLHPFCTPQCCWVAAFCLDICRACHHLRTTREVEIQA